MIISLILIGYISYDKYFYKYFEDQKEQDISEEQKENEESKQQKTEETENKIPTKEERIKENFLNDLKNNQNEAYLGCNKNYNCNNINTFDISDIKLMESTSDGYEIYAITYSWSCKNNTRDCFYNEQIAIENDIYQATVYYKINPDTYKVVTTLGNSYGMTRSS